MIKAINAAKGHMSDLAHGRVPAEDKPSAFHYGLISELLNVIQLMRQDVISADEYSKTAGFVVEHCERKYIELQNELADASGQTLAQIQEQFPLPTLSLPDRPTPNEVEPK